MHKCETSKVTWEEGNDEFHCPESTKETNKCAIFTSSCFEKLKSIEASTFSNFRFQRQFPGDLLQSLKYIFFLRSTDKHSSNHSLVIKFLESKSTLQITLLPSNIFNSRYQQVRPIPEKNT